MQTDRQAYRAGRQVDSYLGRQAGKQTRQADISMSMGTGKLIEVLHSRGGNS